nr:hypothetical protein [Tanacetum cinerariifolium]
MLTEGIKQSESYQMFIKYSISLIPPEKSRCKGSQGKKTTNTPKAAVDMFEESDSKPARKQIGKEEAAREVHATHERITIDSDPRPARRRPLEKLVADTMQALKASRKSIRSQAHVGGSSKGTVTKPRVLGESTVTPTTSKVESGYTKEDDDENIEWVDTDEEEEKNNDDDDKSIDLEKTYNKETDNEVMHGEEYVLDDDEEIDDESVHGDEKVNDDEDEEMTNTEDVDTGNSDEEITNAPKADAEKAKDVKNDIKKAKLPPSGSRLSVSSGFSNQFLNLYSNTSIISTIKDTRDAEINSLLDVQIQ